jgi:hypothetical protein
MAFATRTLINFCHGIIDRRAPMAPTTLPPSVDRHREDSLVAGVGQNFFRKQEWRNKEFRNVVLESKDRPSISIIFHLYSVVKGHFAACAAIHYILRNQYSLYMKTEETKNSYTCPILIFNVQNISYGIFPVRIMNFKIDTVRINDHSAAQGNQAHLST